MSTVKGNEMFYELVAETFLEKQKWMDGETDRPSFLSQF
jgi:hypothetical protein